MDEKYTVDILGTELAVRTDNSGEYLDSLAARLSEDINNILLHNARCTKTEATLMCALSYLDELETQKKQSGGSESNKPHSNS